MRVFHVLEIYTNKILIEFCIYCLKILYNFVLVD